MKTLVAAGWRMRGRTHEDALESREVNGREAASSL